MEGSFHLCHRRKVSTTIGTTEYTLHGKNIVHMTQGVNSLHFYYDAQSRPAVVTLGGTDYAYLYSLQGDVVALVDGSGTKVVEYTYDAWGKPTGKTGTLAATLGTVQPFRYRGYVYDEETGLYYLRSRYYRCEWCRFLNADHSSFAYDGENLFCYCGNEPIICYDPNGHNQQAVDWVRDVGVVAPAPIRFPFIERTQDSILTMIAAIETALITAISLQHPSIAQQNAKEAHNSQEESVEKNAKQAIFPQNPYDFHPLALSMEIKPGTYNGQFFVWFDSQRNAIFRWDEDFKNGSHYHVIGIPGVHFWPGTPIPEPYNTLYFNDR